MSKSALATAVAQKVGINQKTAREAVDAVLEELTQTLAKGERVTIPGFGTFNVKDRPERQARNPSTGEAITVPAQKVVSFKPGTQLKEEVNA